MNALIETSPKNATALSGFVHIIEKYVLNNKKFDGLIILLLGFIDIIRITFKKKKCTYVHLII